MQVLEISVLGGESLQWEAVTACSMKKKNLQCNPLVPKSLCDKSVKKLQVWLTHHNRVNTAERKVDE